MKINKIFVGLLISCFLLSFVSAFTYGVSNIRDITVDGYEGGDGYFEAVITSSSSNVCDITCSWETDNGHGENIGNPEELSEKGESKRFQFKVLLDGSKGSGVDTLRISCEKVPSYYCWTGSDETNFEQQVPLEFDWNGDGDCQTENNVKPEYCTNAKLDCPCSFGKSCIDERGDSSRNDLDSQKCATYCGNEICEKSEGENCIGSSLGGCDDCKKCNGIDCNEGLECEGGYCVHEKCLDNPYKQGDALCDIPQGENCKNSPSDCACGEGERCGSSGICETWCGNNVCEESEKGICKLDCDWCGDGECNNKETCGSCENDCGACESEELNEEIANKTQGIIQKGLSDASRKQNIINYGALGIIVVFLLGYFYFKLIRRKKNHGKKRKKKK